MNTALAFLIGAALGVTIALAVSLARRTPAAAPEAGPPRTSSPARDRSVGIVDRVVDGVVVLDEELTPTLVNRAARRMLGIQPTTSLARLPSVELIELARRAVDEDRDIEELISIHFPKHQRLKIRVSAAGGGGTLLLLQDVTEEVRTYEMRREFVAHASHELKTPVASLQTLAEAVREAVRDDSGAALKFSDSLVVEATRLGRLINDLLDLSRLEDPTALSDQDVDLSAVAMMEIDAATDDLRAKSLRLESVVEPGIQLRGDEQQLSLLIRNLIDNAVRYTPEDGQIRVSVARAGSDATISVEDDGIGIPLEAQKRVFERFYRVDQGRSRDLGGTGLGLAIVKHVAELHGGTVDVTSELDRGSRFVATLPTQPASAERSVAG